MENYASQWRLYEVDRSTWADSGLVGGFLSARVTRDTGSMLESATMEVDGSFPSGERYLRLAMVSDSNGTRGRVDVATLWCSFNSGEWNGTKTNIECLSVLYPAYAKIVRDGFFCPAGTDAVRWCERELQSVLHAPVSSYGSFELSAPICFDLDSRLIDDVWAVLRAGNYCISVDGYGRVSLMPLPSEPTFKVSKRNADMLMNGGKSTQDWSKVPNTYRARLNGMSGEAVNDDPDSPVSTVSRGFAVDYVDNSPALANGETLERYAARRLEELSTVGVEAVYTREWVDGVGPYSLVEIEYGDAGTYMVTSQQVTCKKGIEVTEKAEKGVMLWTR